MKKIVNLVFLLILSCCFLSAQVQEQSSNVANRNTALRCLKLAENCLMAGDWDNAYKQAELGLSYDNSISDLIYVKAAAGVSLNKTRNQSISDIELAFEKNNWVGHTVNGARILYADLLSDVGRYSKSMNVLDEAPFIFSADAEFIRIKNLYRTGTAESIKDARLKVNSSRRVYKNDSRFPNIFFMFELLFKLEAERKGIEYNIPEIVNTIAGSYIAQLPDYEGDKPAIELMASFFADKDTQNRLIRAIDAKNQTKNQTKNPVLAIAGLKSGLYSQEQAFNVFFDMAGDSVALGLIESLAMMITEDDVKSKLVEKLNNYEGKILYDINLDLQPELVIEYSVGRPLYISYDSNNDGVIDIYSICDFGAPKTIYINENKSQISYSDFPNVSQISFPEKGFSFNYIDDDFKFSPIELSVNNILNTFGLELYVPTIVEEIVVPSLEKLESIASSVELPTEERDNSKIVYTILDGKPVFADFYDNGIKYAYCGFSQGYPFTRNVDYDLDGYFETKESYNLSEKEEDYITKEEQDFVRKIFSPVAVKSNIYLSSIKVDRNDNTFYEFSEEYLGSDGKITTWDNNDDGIPDSQYIRYPINKLISDDNSLINSTELKEDTVFFDKNGEVFISINFVNKVPVKMNLQQSEVIIYAGESDNFYWIEEDGNSEVEKYIVENIVDNLTNGIIKIETIGDLRVSVILVNENVFCRIIPDVISDEDLGLSRESESDKSVLKKITQ